MVPMEKVVLLIPLTFNDGSEIPPAILARIRTDFFEHFGGSTVEGTVEGEYRMNDGKKRAERLMKLWVR